MTISVAFALLVVAWLASGAIAAARRAVMVGVVVPRHARPGERISGRLVLKPDDYKPVPGLIVVPVEMNLPVDPAGKPLLDEAFVDNGYGRTSASVPFTATVPTDGSHLDLSCGTGELTKRVRLPIEGTKKPRVESESYTMQPIAPDSGVSMIHGRFDGNAKNTEVFVNDTAAKVVAESSDEAYYSMPASTVNGRNRVVLKQNGKTFTWEVFQPNVEISAERSTLQQGDSTQFKVTVDELEAMPASDWKAGNPSDLYDTERAIRTAKDYSPQANAAGVILLTVKNDSAQTVSMSPSDTFTTPLTRGELARGPKRVEGSVTANEAGGFQIEASIVPMLADVAGIEAPPTGEHEQPRETPKPHRKESPPNLTETRRTPNVEHTPARTSEEDHNVTEDRDLGPPVVYVPGVPVVAPPKCCVITSITVTNRQTYPVFYVLNGKYQSGMSPAPADWVQPGQSRTFTGDFGPCVRIEAFNNRSLDEDGNPIPGLFDDQTVCCKDLLSGKNKGQGFSYTINSVEWREWKDCPENPPVPVAPPPVIPKRTPTVTLTPSATPTATPTETATPTDTPTPSDTPTPEPPHEPPPIIPVVPPETSDCPQRGKGCAALIVDFMENDSIFNFSFKKLEEPLRNMGCDVDAIYPEFWEVPHTDFISVKDPNSGATTHIPTATGSDLEAIHAAVNHNITQWRNVEVTINLHRQKLEPGRELAIELVSAHGSMGYEDKVVASGLNQAGQVVPGDCGGWGPSETTGGYETGLNPGSWGADLNSGMGNTELSRQKFIRNNHLGTIGNVCDWFMYDGSCYSGKTPMVFDQIENTAAASCSRKAVVNCPIHAGWEADVAGGVSWSDVKGHNGDAGSMAGDLKDIFNNTAAARKAWTEDGSPYSYAPLMKTLSDLVDKKSQTWITPGSFYSDKGYHDDRPPPAQHPNRGYR